MKIVALFLLAAAAAPTAELRYFRYQRTVEPPQNASGQVCAILDSQTFTHAAPGLTDLRLYRAGVGTPYVIHDSMPARTSAPSIEPMNLGSRGGKTVFDAAMPDGPYSDVQLTITGQNFLATVTVFGSQAEAGTVTRIGSYTIFDFTGQRLGRSTMLHLPKSNFRFLHFEVSGPISPEHVTGIVAAPQPQGEPRYITVTSNVHFTQNGGDSVAEFTIPAQVPVDRIVFTPMATPVNFSRPVEIKITSDSPAAPDSSRYAQPDTTAFGDLLRIHRAQEGHRIDEEQLSIETSRFAMGTTEKWTITVHNGDDAPIQFTSVVVQMLERDLCFEAAAGSQYSLYYGDNVLSAPRYDYAAWFTPLATSPSATLGAEQENTSYEPRPDSRPFTERYPWLLWVALIAVVGLLGVIALRTAKRMEPPAPMP